MVPIPHGKGRQDNSSSAFGRSRSAALPRMRALMPRSLLLVQRSRQPLRRSSEAHTSELQSLMLISYAVFCLKQKIKDYIDISVNRSKKNTMHNITNSVNIRDSNGCKTIHN